MRGFLFSMEALAAAAVIILAIGVLAYSSSLGAAKANNTEIQGQAQEKMGLYFNDPLSSPNPLAKEQYCIKMTDYNYITKTLMDKNSCWWPK